MFFEATLPKVNLAGHCPVAQEYADCQHLTLIGAEDKGCFQEADNP